MYTEAIDWTTDGRVRLLDQTRLPSDEVFLEIDAIPDMVEAIHALRVRGAPLIGVAAAMGLAASALRQFGNGHPRTRAEVEAWVLHAGRELSAARPTAVNLSWAVERMVRAARRVLDQAQPFDHGWPVVEALWLEAQQIWDEDAAMCEAIGDAGARLVPRAADILTICNTGMLATGGIGTAFGVLRRAWETGRVRTVYACETRPLRQGARLTAWELARLGMPGVVLVDGAAAALLARGRITMVIAGADRIAMNGDAANKIGTLGLARLAAAYRVPFYIAAPRSTIDPATATGEQIPIEERDGREVDPAPGVRVFNPAFDVTPAPLISGIVTDRGVLRPPFSRSIARIMDQEGP